MLRQLAALTDTISHLHAIQHRLTQAEAAAATAGQLRRLCQVTSQRGADDPDRQPQRVTNPASPNSSAPSSLAALAMLSFPSPPGGSPGPIPPVDDPAPSHIGVLPSRGPHR